MKYEEPKAYAMRGRAKQSKKVRGRGRGRKELSRAAISGVAQIILAKDDVALHELRINKAINSNSKKILKSRNRLV